MWSSIRATSEEVKRLPNSLRQGIKEVQPASSGTRAPKLPFALMQSLALCSALGRETLPHDGGLECWASAKNHHLWVQDLTWWNRG